MREGGHGEAEVIGRRRLRKRSRGSRLFGALLVAWLVAGIPGPTFPQPEPKREALTAEATAEGAKGSGVEQVALGTASVLISVVQVPLRTGTCVATVVVAGFAYLLTAFDREARQSPGDAIERVCGGSYVTTPEDLRGD